MNSHGSSSCLMDAAALITLCWLGSWAEYLYRELGVLKGFDPNIRTLDIDFLARNLRKPSEPLGLASAAREAGYLVEFDRLTGATKIMDRSGLEIEFLIGKMGAGAESALKTNIGVTAQEVDMRLSLRHSFTVMLSDVGHRFI